MKLKPFDFWREKRRGEWIVSARPPVDRTTGIVP